MPEKRIFIAIHYQPSPDFIHWFNELKSMVAQEEVKWTSEHNFHITLKFIGDTPDHLIAPLATSLQKVAQTFNPFELIPHGFGYFGPVHMPKVFWTALDDPTQTLPSLAMAVDVACQKQLLTNPEDHQPFKAHLTLGRPKKVINPQRVKDWVNKFRNDIFQSVVISEFALVWSTLTPSGPIYKTLFTFPLHKV